MSKAIITKKSRKIFYYIIIAIMLGGIGFFIYKNNILNRQERSPAESSSQEAINQNIKLDDIATVEEDLSGESLEDNQISTNEIKSEDKENINIDILVDPRYRKLKENYIKPEDFKVGNRNPFKAFD